MSATIRHISHAKGPVRADISAAGRLQIHFADLTISLPPEEAHDLVAAINHALLEEHLAANEEWLPQLPAVR